MHNTLCEGKPGVCPKMNPVDGTELLEYLKKSQFKGKSLVINDNDISWFIRIK